MSKIHIGKIKYNFLNKHLKIYKSRDIISEQQYSKIISLYNIRTVNTIQLFTILGVVLISLGLITYISSKWESLDEIFKLLIVIFMYVISNFISCITYKNYRKTSTSMLYLGVFIYGAGIMLTQNIFNNNIGFVPSGMLWIIGTIPLIYFFEEKIIFIFSTILYMLFSLLYMDTYTYTVLGTYMIIFGVSTIKFKKDILCIMIRDISLYATIPQYLVILKIEPIYIMLIMAFIGVVLLSNKFKNTRELYKLEGLILVGIFGLYLTVSTWWEVLFNDNISYIVSYIVGGVYFGYFVYKSVKGNPISILFIVALVIRYFYDSILLTVPKSITFVAVGGILLFSGFYLENNIKKKGR